jgi:putative thiamine transport system ATP-binding protein
MLAHPRALLLDKPFLALDPELSQDVRTLVFAEIAQANIPALLVSHDPDDRTVARGPYLHLKISRSFTG